MIGRMEDWRLIIGRLEVDYWKIGDWRSTTGRLEVEDWETGRLVIGILEDG